MMPKQARGLPPNCSTTLDEITSNVNVNTKNTKGNIAYSEGN